jgi:starch synthase
MEALKRTGISTVWFCVSGRVNEPLYFTHAPSGGTICLLPVPALYRNIRRRILNPYASTIEQAAGDVYGIRRACLAALKEIMPYLATPLRLLARELRAQNCRAILCQEYEHARFDLCVLLGRLIGLPVFATFQGGDTQLSQLEFLLRPFTVRSCAGLIVAPASEAERLLLRYGLPAKQLARIFNPVDLALWHATDRDEARRRLSIARTARVAIWHGRVDLHRKGLDLLLDAWKQLRCGHPGQDLLLMLIGTGPDAKVLGQRIGEMRLEGILWVNKFLHDPEEIQRYLSAADVYVFPSRHEGFAVAPIEAMACALPVVSANAPGMADIFSDGEASGGVVVAHENPGALAAAVARLWDDKAWAQTLGTRARRRAEASFSLESVGAQLRAFLSSRGVSLVTSAPAETPSPLREKTQTSS